MPDFALDSLLGGMDDFTPISKQGKNTCAIAENVEFFYSTLGERRGGTTPVDLSSSTIPANVSLDAVVWMYWHTPTKNESENELWIMTTDTDPGLTPHLFRRVAGVWSAVAFFSVNDTPVMTGDDCYRIYGQSLHGKLFIAFRSLNDRLHVWDGTNLRPVGLATTTAPGAANGGGAGAYAAIPRFYRTRFLARTGSVILRRSEPSDPVSITPSGANANVTVTRGAVVSEGEDSWELEGSADGLVYYRIVIIPIATATYADTDNPANYSSGPLSDPIGSYALVASARYLLAVDDRLMTAGSFMTAADGSAVQWTPVGTDPLPGPDERYNRTTSPRIDLDGQEGGDITGLAHAEAAILAGKVSHTYLVLKQNSLIGAYDAQPLSKTIGVMPRSFVEAVDENGHGSTYWFDKKSGAMRYGATGMQFCGIGIRNAWQAVNTLAPNAIHGVFYAKKLQVHYWVCQQPVGVELAQIAPNVHFTLQTNVMVPDGLGGVKGGWSIVPLRGLVASGMASARCSVMAAPDISGVGSFTHLPVPHIGKAAWSDSIGNAVRRVVQICDSGSTDEGPANEQSYTGKVRTRAFWFAGLGDQLGVLECDVLGTAGSRAIVSIIRDFGTETIPRPVDMTAIAAETHVIGAMDSLSAAGMFAVSFQFEDDPAHITQWRLHAFNADVSYEQT